MTTGCRLDTLPSEVLIIIFDYCHAFDLVRLSEVCKRFHEIIQHDEILWAKKSDQPLVTNQTSKRFLARCNPELSTRTKWQISHNWQYGKYNKRIIFSHRNKLMPWLQLTEDTLWWSGGNKLYGLSRKGPVSCKRTTFAQKCTDSEVCKFIVRNDYIISGHRDGSVKFWSHINSGNYAYDPENRDYFLDHSYYTILNAHSSDVNAIEETPQVIISGSADGTAKVWSKPDGTSNGNEPLVSVNVHDRIWALAADPIRQKFATGSTGIDGGAPLHIFDIESSVETNIMIHAWRRGAGILDMVWDNPQTLLTCGYDTCVRKWDLRSGKCVSHWSDPTDATVYCLSSDYRYSIVTGGQFNCKAVLWDQRKINYVQLYFMNLHRISSPLYSLCFDSSHLYGATDQLVVELKFSGRRNKENNYRKMLRYEWSNDQNVQR